MMATTVLCPLAASRQRKDVRSPSKAAGVILMHLPTLSCGRELPSTLHFTPWLMGARGTEAV